jgi:hypothetical protein
MKVLSRIKIFMTLPYALIACSFLDWSVTNIHCLMIIEYGIFLFFRMKRWKKSLLRYSIEIWWLFQVLNLLSHLLNWMSLQTFIGNILMHQIHPPCKQRRSSCVILLSTLVLEFLKKNIF